MNLAVRLKQKRPTEQIGTIFISMSMSQNQRLVYKSFGQQQWALLDNDTLSRKHHCGAKIFIPFKFVFETKWGRRSWKLGNRIGEDEAGERGGRSSNVIFQELMMADITTLKITAAFFVWG